MHFLFACMEACTSTRHNSIQRALVHMLRIYIKTLFLSYSSVYVASKLTRGIDVPGDLQHNSTSANYGRSGWSSEGLRANLGNSKWVPQVRYADRHTCWSRTEQQKSNNVHWF